MKRPELSDLPARVDLLIVGGGITGAGIFREAAHTGASILLVEKQDFASGTSSGSSKLVHGGLRYLKTGHWRLTRESVRERQRLLREAAGLVLPQPFLMPVYRGTRPGRAALRTGLWIYDRMAGPTARRSRWIDRDEALALEPHLRADELLGAMLYEDAWTDDARLVIRLIADALREPVLARNYTELVELLRRDGVVRGGVLRDGLTGATREIEAAMVVNATGAWAGRLAPGAPPLRPLRGSHLVFPLAKLPVRRAVSWLHPRDRRPIFVYPWEGVAVFGTTDVDHDSSLERPRCSPQELQYLLEGLAHQFPGLALGAADALCSYSAVRPIVAGGRADPSAESRESALWSSPGLVGVTGGKLTTFRITARQVLREAARQHAALAPVPMASVFGTAGSSRHAGRLGEAGRRYVEEGPAPEREPLMSTPYSRAELRWSARHEQVVQLEDLMLRRTRLGLIAPRGGEDLLPVVHEVCRAELGWDDRQWQLQVQAYRERWQESHAV